MHRIGRAGQIDTPARSYGLVILADHVIATTGAGSRRFEVPNYGTAIGKLAARPGFRIGWAQFADGTEVLDLYDRDDECFGYAINLDDPGCSEWGYAPFDG
jgi:hypothetical protein